MLKWIENDKVNAAIFIANPINALARMGLKNEKILLKKLRYLNTKNRSIKMPSAKIPSIVVETSKKTVKDAVEGM